MFNAIFRCIQCHLVFFYCHAVKIVASSKGFILDVDLPVALKVYSLDSHSVDFGDDRTKAIFFRSTIISCDVVFVNFSFPEFVISILQGPFHILKHSG